MSTHAIAEETYRNPRRNRRSFTGEYLSPWTADGAWSFNPKNIAVISAPSRHRRTGAAMFEGSGEFTHRAATRRGMSVLQKVTVGLLIFSIALIGIISTLIFT